MTASTFKVPFETKKKKEELRLGTHRVVLAEDPCLTCGHYRRLQWMERVDGKKKLKEVCLFCVTKIHTKANREGQ
jgi:hypothetical protein